MPRVVTAARSIEIPVGVQDLVDIAGVPTTPALAVPPREPRHDAPVVTNCAWAGARDRGKTNLHEFAFGTTSDETAFGHRAESVRRIALAGGSSGGAAVAIVEGMVLGSGDGHGRVDPDSLRRLRNDGAEAGYAEISLRRCRSAEHDALDHFGPMTRTVVDARSCSGPRGSAAPRVDEGGEPGEEELWRASLCTFSTSGIPRRVRPSDGSNGAARGGPQYPRRHRIAHAHGRRTSTSTSCCPRRRGITRHLSSRMQRGIRPA